MYHYVVRLLESPNGNIIFEDGWGDTADEVLDYLLEEYPGCTVWSMHKELDDCFISVDLTQTYLF